MQRKKKALITDLDNTLFDCIALWATCFSGMLDKIVEISGIPAPLLKADIRRIHQKHGTSEYSFLIEELGALRDKYPDDDLLEVFAPAIEEFRKRRNAYLALYPSVAETILKIKGSGALIIGYTESMAFYSNYRVSRLGLDGVFDFIFCPEDHDVPHSLSLAQLNRYPSSRYQLRYTVQHHVPRWVRKPDHAVLVTIMSDQKLKVEDCVYVGNSLFKDVAMAQAAGVDDVWAKYGESHERSEYHLLSEVSHWTDDELDRANVERTKTILPSYILKTAFSELLDQFEFIDREA